MAYILRISATVSYADDSVGYVSIVIDEFGNILTNDSSNHPVDISNVSSFTNSFEEFPIPLLLDFLNETLISSTKEISEITMLVLVIENNEQCAILYNNGAWDVYGNLEMALNVFSSNENDVGLALEEVQLGSRIPQNGGGEEPSPGGDSEGEEFTLLNEWDFNDANGLIETNDGITENGNTDIPADSVGDLDGSSGPPFNALVSSGSIIDQLGDGNDGAFYIELPYDLIDMTGLDGYRVDYRVYHELAATNTLYVYDQDYSSIFQLDSNNGNGVTNTRVYVNDQTLEFNLDEVFLMQNATTYDVSLIHNLVAKTIQVLIDGESILEEDVSSQVLNPASIKLAMNYQHNGAPPITEFRLERVRFSRLNNL